MEENDKKQESEKFVRQLKDDFKTLQEKVTQLSGEVKTLRTRGAPPGGSVELPEEHSSIGGGYFNSRLMVTSLLRKGESTPPDSYDKNRPDESEPKDVKSIEYNKNVDGKKVYSLYHFRKDDAVPGNTTMSVLARNEEKTMLMYISTVYEGF